MDMKKEQAETNDLQCPVFPDSPDGGSPNGDVSGEVPHKGSGDGAEYVFSVFRQTGALTDLIWSAVIMPLLFFFGAFLIVPPILVLFAFPYVPGVLVRREFIRDVIPSCRYTCTEEAIVRGAVKSLCFMWGRYLLCILPLFLLGCYFIPARIFAFFSGGKSPFFGFGGLVVCSILVTLLGVVPLAIFPVARLFSRRWGMIVMLPLIVLGQIIAIGNSLFGASGFIFFTDGDPHVEEYSAFSTFILIICAMFFVVGIAYFVHAAYHDAEENGLMY